MAFTSRLFFACALITVPLLLASCTASVDDDEVILSEAETLRVDRDCLRVRLLWERADDAGRRRLAAAYPACFATVDERSPDRLGHCPEIRLLAERFADDPLRFRRIVSAYPECFARRDPGSDEIDRCDALRRRAAAATTVEERRRYLAAYYDCIDGDERPEVTCGDGSRPLCRSLPPTCARGEALAVIDSCWACVSAERCEPPPEHPCLRLRRAAAAALEAGDRELFRTYEAAYLRCIGAGEPPLSCATVLCAEAHHCVESPRGPVCIPDDCRAVTDDSGFHVVCADPGEPCTREWAPVCGTDGVTYGNVCLARAAGVRPLYEGECRPEREPAPAPEPTPSR